MRVAPEQTFFMPWARAHQLLIGAAAAVVVHAMSLAAARGSGGPAGWLVRNPVPGVVLTPLRMAAVAFLIALLVVPQFEIASPGPVALLVSIPVAFVALTGNGTDLLSRLGGWWPLAWIARLSYVIYLWHWPVWVVVIAQLGHVRGREQLAVAGAVTLVLSLATHFAVEQPFRDGYRVRRMPPLRTAVLGLGASVLAAAVVLAAAAVAPTRPWQQDVRPPIEELASDTSDIYDRECQSVSGWTRAKVCTDGPEGGQKVMIIGDSHGASWATPMQSLAEQEQWQYFNVTKARCSIWDVPTLLAGKRYVACEKWRVNALRAATAERPDVIVLHSTIPWEQMLDDEGQPVADREAALADAVTASVRAMRRTGATVVAMLDTPTATAKDGVPVESCLATADDPAECDFPSRSGSPERAVLREAAEKAGAVVVDPYPAICPDSVCTVVQDGVVVYRDAGHLTRTYALDQRQWVRSWLRPLLAARPGQ
jgi:hypothetical protein